MRTKLKNVAAVVALALALAGQASAATDWLLNTGTATGSNSAVTAASSAWADTGSLASNSLAAGALAQQPGSAYFTQYGSSGLGINNIDGCSGTNCGGDAGDLYNVAQEHAIDNNERYEMVLISFSQSVALTNVKFGWVGTDSDYTVLAYGGAGAPPLTGSSWASMTGWTLIENYSNAKANVNNAINTTTTTPKYSSYWLIGAYNPLGGTPLSKNGIDTGNDYLKLASVTGLVCTTGSGPNCTPNGKVSEPDSLALLGFAMLGMLGLRSRRRS